MTGKPQDTVQISNCPHISTAHVTRFRPRYSPISPSLIGRLFAASLIWLVQSLPALAHASEQALVLLLPTDLYIFAGCAAVVASILGVAFLSEARLMAAFKSLTLFSIKLSDNVTHVTSFASMTFLFAISAIGAFGTHDPLDNLFSLTIWAIWWVGLVLAHGVLGNLWQALNPWTGLYHILIGYQSTPPYLKLPKACGHWIAVLVFLAFGMFEIADPAPEDPARLTKFVLGYWLFTFVGMILFGGKVWLSRCEPFTILFDLVATISPVRWVPRFCIGLPGWSLFSLSMPSVSLAVFSLTLLGVGSFDGLKESFWWLAKIGVNPLMFPGKSAIFWQSIFGILAINVALVMVFAAVVYVGIRAANASLASQDRVAFTTAFCWFSLSIIPIALGYHFAHFFIYFLVNSQYALLALTDPLTTGANYLGLAKTQVTTGFLKTKDSVQVVFFIQAGAVVVSHVVSVLIAHGMAARLYQTKKQTLISQIPLAIFMVLYTIFGLWLLATPRGM